MYFVGRGTMNKTVILEHISRLPAVEQMELVESVLHELGAQLRQGSFGSGEKRTLARQQLAAAAAEAEAYYRADPDVALWSGLEGEPVHEYDAGENLAGGSGTNHRSGNGQDPPGAGR